MQQEKHLHEIFGLCRRENHLFLADYLPLSSVSTIGGNASSSTSKQVPPSVGSPQLGQSISCPQSVHIARVIKSVIPTVGSEATSCVTPDVSPTVFDKSLRYMQVGPTSSVN